VQDGLMMLELLPFENDLQNQTYLVCHHIEQYFLGVASDSHKADTRHNELVAQQYYTLQFPIWKVEIKLLLLCIVPCQLL